MRPVDIEREIERVTVEAATAREQLVSLRERVSEARAIVEEVRRGLTGSRRSEIQEAD